MSAGDLTNGAHPLRAADDDMAWLSKQSVATQITAFVLAVGMPLNDKVLARHLPAIIIDFLASSDESDSAPSAGYSHDQLDRDLDLLRLAGLVPRTPPWFFADTDGSVPGDDGEGSGRGSIAVHMVPDRCSGAIETFTRLHGSRRVSSLFDAISDWPWAWVDMTRGDPRAATSLSMFGSSLLGCLSTKATPHNHRDTMRDLVSLGCSAPEWLPWAVGALEDLRSLVMRSPEGVLLLGLAAALQPSEGQISQSLALDPTRQDRARKAVSREFLAICDAESRLIESALAVNKAPWESRPATGASTALREASTPSTGMDSRSDKPRSRGATVDRELLTLDKTWKLFSGLGPSWAPLSEEIHAQMATRLLAAELVATARAAPRARRGLVVVVGSETVVPLGVPSQASLLRRLGTGDLPSAGSTSGDQSASGAAEELEDVARFLSSIDRASLLSHVQLRSYLMLDPAGDTAPPPVPHMELIARLAAEGLISGIISLTADEVLDWSLARVLEPDSYVRIVGQHDVDSLEVILGRGQIPFLKPNGTVSDPTSLLFAATKEDQVRNQRRSTVIGFCRELLANTSHGITPATLLVGCRDGESGLAEILRDGTPSDSIYDVAMCQRRTPGANRLGAWRVSGNRFAGTDNIRGLLAEIVAQDPPGALLAAVASVQFFAGLFSSQIELPEAVQLQDLTEAQFLVSSLRAKGRITEDYMEQIPGLFLRPDLTREVVSNLATESGPFTALMGTWSGAARAYQVSSTEQLTSYCRRLAEDVGDASEREHGWIEWAIEALRRGPSVAIARRIRPQIFLGQPQWLRSYGELEGSMQALFEDPQVSRLCVVSAQGEFLTGRIAQAAAQFRHENALVPLSYEIVCARDEDRPPLWEPVGECPFILAPDKFLGPGISKPSPVVELAWHEQRVGLTIGLGEDDRGGRWHPVRAVHLRPGRNEPWVQAAALTRGPDLTAAYSLYRLLRRHAFLADTPYQIQTSEEMPSRQVLRSIDEVVAHSAYKGDSHWKAKRTTIELGLGHGGDTNSVVWIAFRGTHPIGFIASQSFSDVPDPVRRFLIVVSQSAWSGYGVASCLLERMEMALFDDRRDSQRASDPLSSPERAAHFLVSPDDAGARHFLEDHGYRQVDGGDLVPAAQMRMPDGLWMEKLRAAPGSAWSNPRKREVPEPETSIRL